MGTERHAPETVGMATETVERGHETHDARIGMVIAVGAGLALTIAVVQVALYFQIGGLWRHRQAALSPASPVAEALPSAPPEPRLQTAPPLDLRDLRTAEAAQLEGYGWIDRQAGIAHIPIERAMELVARDAGAKR
jgi:hypothetical protein